MTANADKVWVYALHITPIFDRTELEGIELYSTYELAQQKLSKFLCSDEAKYYYAETFALEVRGSLSES